MILSNKKTKKSNIWLTSKHISKFGCINTICCGNVHVRCHKMMIVLLFLELGIFFLKFGEKNILFAIENMTKYRSPKWTKNPDMHGSNICYSGKYKPIYEILILIA